MTNPFEILNIPETADDTQIKNAYLEKVRESPPDCWPEQFKTVRCAYEKIKTEKSRLAFELFDNYDTDVRVLCQKLLTPQRGGRPSKIEFKEMLAETIASVAKPSRS